MLDSKYKEPDKNTINDIKRLKEKLAFLNKKEEKTQEELNNYISSLNDEEICKYMTSMKDIINLCDNHLFDCKFKSNERFKFQDSLKPECKREDILRLKRIL